MQVFWVDILAVSDDIILLGKMFIAKRALISLIGHSPCTVIYQAVVGQNMFGEKFQITSVAVVLQFILRNIPVKGF